MAINTVTVGCNLPHGLWLEHPANSEDKRLLRGQNSGDLVIPKTTYASTEIPADFWEAWFSAHKGSDAVKSRAIFVAKNLPDATAAAKENKDVKTGFEQANPEELGIEDAKSR